MPAGALDIATSRFRDDGTAYLSARRVASLLGVTLTELAALTGVARNTLTAKTGARKVDIALSPVVRILAMASEMAGDDQRAARQRRGGERLLRRLRRQHSHGQRCAEHQQRGDRRGHVRRQAR